MRSISIGIAATALLTGPACAEPPDLEVAYQQIQLSSIGHQAVVGALIVSKDDGRGWSCSFVFDIGAGVAARASTCRPLSYDGPRPDGLTAVSSSGNGLPAFPSFVAVDRSGRNASACVVHASAKSPAAAVCGTARLR